MLSYLGNNFLGAGNLFLQSKLLCSAASQHFVRVPERGLKLFSPSVRKKKKVCDF